MCGCNKVIGQKLSKRFGGRKLRGQGIIYIMIVLEYVYYPYKAKKQLRHCVAVMKDASANLAHGS